MKSKQKYNVKYLSKHGFIIILCTIPDDKTMAVNIATILLHKRIVACVTILQNGTSLYLWEKKMQYAKEIQLIIKSHTSLTDNIFQEIKKHHPYEVPELFVLPIMHIETNYLSWLQSSLNL